MEATLRKPPPDWDRREVARPYLDELQTKFRQDEIEDGFLDSLFSGLSQELRAVYFGGDADRALEGLDRLIEKYDLRERERRSVTPGRTHVDILKRWSNISRRAMPRMAPPPQNSNNIQTAPLPRQTAPEPVTAPPTRSRLKGRAMAKSTFGTWMKLVALTWIALVLNGVFTLFFGVGAVVFATMFGSFFSVPAWATLWSWLGRPGPARFAP